ncbi:hypothetical protein CL617_01950 [archaeon]|nr:hypothetical protein [archaeon]|tara:strand:+ start:4133 stop:4447 length:315 start_codon:yes stop_codon:yes gene_type:complete
MAKERKIKCDCGGFLVERKTIFDHFETDAMVCTKCNFTTLTKQQAEEYIKLKQLHQIVDAERKIIKIGNSMGFTLPDRLQEYGVKVGSKVKIEAIGPKAFKVKL